MKKNLLKKGLIIGVICLFIMISFPVVTSEFIDYPKEEGPYTVFIGGKTYGGSIAKPFFLNTTIGFQFGPFCKYNYPWGPEYNMLNGSIFLVNGKIQKYEFPAQIGLLGFKGFAPAMNQLSLKILMQGRIRTFGVCEEIYLWYGLEPK